MNVYRGQQRRQIGGGIWSTIVRGVKPALVSLLSKLKPHAIEAGKHAAKSALSVGSRLAMDAVTGDFSKARAKAMLKNEANQLKADAIHSLKRKLSESSQSGRGYKRRRIDKRSKKKKMTPKSYKRKTAIKRKKASHCKTTKSPRRKQYKRKNNKIVKRKTKRRVRKTVSRKAIKDIFG